LLLRRELDRQPNRIPVFNPRGQKLVEVDQVRRIGGLVLRALDPRGEILGSMRHIPRNALGVFAQWRAHADSLLRSPNAPNGLKAHVDAWGRRDAGDSRRVWPKNVPVLQLLFNLRHFYSDLQNEPESQIFLDVFTRQLSACEQVASFGGDLVVDPAKPDLEAKSIESLLRNFLLPIATGAVKVNEELLDALPLDHLNILSVHQAKGLEFPFVIVDVGSDFKINHAKQAFKRFPQEGGLPHELEDRLRPFSPLKGARREQRDRCFDDLYRQYFVAFSRPRDALLLVGLASTRPGGGVPNVATGCDRTGVNRWAASLPFTDL
jgi:DNA helicase-2/ATP-dependent DNA helicase PcrA